MPDLGLPVRAVARTDPGRQRSNNEDAVIVHGSLLGVADGMGGHEGGEVASAMAIGALAALGAHASPDAVVEAMVRANQEIRAADAESGAPTGMGTTCTTVVVAGAVAHIAHIGDSRAYLFRGGQLQQLTRDHALLAEMVRTGVLTRDQADHDERRNVILRALGAADRPDIDRRTVALEPGDRLLLCSDGLTTPVPDAEIALVLASAADPGTAADRLVALANAVGGPDNISVVVAEITDAAATAAPAPVPTAVRTRRSTRGRAVALIVVLIAVLALAAALVLGGALGPAPTLAPSVAPSAAPTPAASRSVPGQTVDGTPVPSPTTSSASGGSVPPSSPAAGSPAPTR